MHINNRGSILVLTLWVLFFLAALAVAVGGHVASNLRVASKIKGRVTAYYLARAGAEKAVSEARGDSNAWDGLNELWSSGEELFRDVALGQGSYSVYYTYISPFGGVATNYGMYDEERKININKASEPLLKAMLQNIGQLDTMTASDVTAAIIDWRDQNDVTLTGGAENSHYAALSNPYQCHNGDFQSLHELLLVKKVSSDLFLKLKPYITIYGTGKVNINTADPIVLVCMGEAGGGGDRATCRLLADKIARFRAGGNTFTDPSITTQLNAFVKIEPVEKTVLSRMMGGLAIKSSCFGGIAGGKTLGSSMEDRQIEFVFDRQRGVKLYWHEF
ncbi:MAG: type II secretion system protein GspK [Kiritimatiellae bacterium]|nr:type II secretion system protein GspK [Kiritimatiellia bacterium]MDD5521939.1 type II secretion system protein GspK [Kiritimatiellia bacterium]